MVRVGSVWDRVRRDDVFPHPLRRVRDADRARPALPQRVDSAQRHGVHHVCGAGRSGSREVYGN